MAGAGPAGGGGMSRLSGGGGAVGGGPDGSGTLRLDGVVGVWVDGGCGGAAAGVGLPLTGCAVQVEDGSGGGLVGQAPLPSAVGAPAMRDASPALGPAD